MVFVLLSSNDQLVFKNFDSKDMERVISDSLPSGSGLYFDRVMDLTRSLEPDPSSIIPTEAQIQKFTAFCKKKGITLKFRVGT
jgi:hypothetical protein